MGSEWPFSVASSTWALKAAQLACVVCSHCCVGCSAEWNGCTTCWHPTTQQQGCTSDQVKLPWVACSDSCSLAGSLVICRQVSHAIKTHIVRKQNVQTCWLISSNRSLEWVKMGARSAYTNKCINIFPTKHGTMFTTPYFHIGYMLYLPSTNEFIF